MKKVQEKMVKTTIPGVFRLADGRLWVRATAMCPRTGKKLAATRSMPAKASLHDGARMVAQLKHELLEPATKATSQQQTLRDYATRWLEGKSARLRPSVSERYVDVLGRHILPRLGGLRLDQLRRNDVDVWVAWAEKVAQPSGRPYSGETLMTWWRLLSQILKDAAAELGLPDPTNRVRPPVKHTAPCRERRTLTPEQFTLFLQKAAELVPDRYPEIATLAMTGMRAGEVYGLKWSDIDEDEGSIRIQRSASHGHVTLTKTGDPRVVPMPDVLKDVLHTHRQALIAARHRGLSTGLVFPADNGGHRIPQSLHKVTKLLAKRCEIDVEVGPQVLRRTFNTLMLRFNVGRETLRAMMGHTTEAMTQRYAGVPLDQKHEAVANLPGVRKPEDPVAPEPGRGGLRVIVGGRDKR